MRPLKTTIASKSKIVQSTGFGSYDFCANPYVGCQFGCTYCYVRFFVKDVQRPWGEFVRTRNHLRTKFPKELSTIAGKKLAIGTMTDPYQPTERKERLTRAMLEAIKTATNKPSEVGIFTRSPIVRDDLQLIKEIGARIHLTITPYAREVLTKIEPIAVTTEARFKLAEDLVKAGISVHLSISPVMPVLSDPFTDEFVRRIVQVFEAGEAPRFGFTIDPMQAYGAAFEATDAALKDNADWIAAAAVISDPAAYSKWKALYINTWKKAWAPHAAKAILPIMMDHAGKSRHDLRTGAQIDFKNFSYT